MKTQTLLILMLVTTTTVFAQDKAETVMLKVSHQITTSVVDAKHQNGTDMTQKSQKNSITDVSLEEPCQGWLIDLTNQVHDTRERAAYSLYHKCDRHVLAKSDTLADALIESLRLGNSNAAAVLLLGNFNDDNTVKILQQLSTQTEVVKLDPWLKPVEVSIPASISLSRLHDEDGEAKLNALVVKESLSMRVFLLNVIEEIETKKTLELLIDYLTDTREISGGVPGGVIPQRRLCDLAVDSLVQRLNLFTGFELTPSRRYSREQLTTVDKLAHEKNTR